MSGFGDLVAGMDAEIFDSLHDSLGELHQAGKPLRCGLQLIVDHNLQRVGAEGLFASDAVGISCRVAQVGDVRRGDIFVVGRKRYTVEDVIRNDGHVISAACMVTP